MKILVAVKRVIDAYVHVRVKKDRTGVETTNVKTAMNPFDEIAVEQAVRLKEQNIADEIIAVSIGDSSSQEVLRTALALGADRALLVEHAEILEPLNIAKILTAVAKQESPDLIILGKQSIDGDHNQTGQMLAALLNWPQGTFISSLKLLDGEVEVVREIDGGLETLNLTLPAVVTTDLRLNEPRYPSLPNIMKAKKKPLATTTTAELNVEVKPHLTMLTVEPPAARSAGIMVADVTELVKKLKDEAKVIG